MQPILATFEQAATQPLAYARQWKQANGRQVVGSFPMHFPGELIHAAGALPVVLQEEAEPITVGHGQRFHRSTAATPAASSTRLPRASSTSSTRSCSATTACSCSAPPTSCALQHPDNLSIFYQLISLDARPLDARRTRRRRFGAAACELEGLLGRDRSRTRPAREHPAVQPQPQLMRELYDLRRAGQGVAFRRREMQASSSPVMVMDKAEHTALLGQLIETIEPQHGARGALACRSSSLRPFLPAPKPEVLDLIEECGAIVVDDDLYTGFRYISTDMDEDGDPVDAMAQLVPRPATGRCPARRGSMNEARLGRLPAERGGASGAQGMIVLMAKFCEPHMYLLSRDQGGLRAATAFRTC